MAPSPGFTEIATTTLRHRSKAMPIGPTKTKAQKQAVVHTEMHKFKHGTLHSGSKSGPVVHDRAQAIAIALSESHQSKPSVPPSRNPSGTHGYGHDVTQRSGHTRNSGHSGAHRVGKR